MSMSMSISKMSVKKVVEECGKLYNFNAEEALRALNIEVKEKKEKKEKVVVNKSKYPLPFNGEKKEKCCNGIVKNHGLYTQCSKKISLAKDGEPNSGFCKGCESQPYGNIDDRVKVDLYSYKDPKGKSPKRYTEVLKKLKITKETIEEEVKRLNITINPIHFEEVAENVKRGRPKSEKKVKEPTGKKGRPKKETKVLEVNNEEEEDLFATLIANANAQPLKKVEPNSVEEVVTAITEEEVEEVVEEVVEESKEVPSPKGEKKAKKVKEVDAAKEAEKQKKAEEKAAKEAEKQKKAEEKAAKEQAKEAEKQKKAEEKAAKEAEKQKKAEEKAAKEQAKESKKTSKALSSPSQKVDEEEADVVQKIEFEGKPYYKSKKNGIIYNMDQEVVGKWNTERKAIDFEEEEEEEEYDD